MMNLKIETETDVKVPGTIHLIDVEGNLDVAHEAGDDIVLVPQPTLNPEDPLNWSKSRKYRVAICLLLAVFAADILTTVLSAVLLVIEDDTGIPLGVLNSGVGVQYLFFGWSNLLWQPLGLTYGRRPVLLFSLLACMLCSVWTSYVKSSGEWYVNRFLCGFFYGPIETLIEVCIADIFFLHERGAWIAWYCFMLFSIPFASSIAAGFISDRYGWQWIQFIAAIITAVILVILFFFLEETMFYRDHILEQDPIEQVKSSDRIIDSKKNDTNVNVEKIQTPESPINNPNGKSFIERLKFWGARDPRQKNVFFQSIWIPFYLLRYPGIIFAGFTVGAVLSWFNVLNATISSVLSGSPYNFSPNMIGVFFASPFIGIAIGSWFSGSIVDKFTILKARKGKGMREPETRLFLSILPMLIHPFGCFLYGIGAEKGIHWVGLAFGAGMICSTFPIGSAIAINYIIDCYKEVSGDGLVTMILVRNSMGFGFSYAVTPWLVAVGIQNLYIAIGLIGMAIWATSFLMIIFGKRFRKASAISYWKLIDKFDLKAH